MNKEEAEEIYKDIHNEKVMDCYLISDKLNSIYRAFNECNEKEKSEFIKYETMICDLVIDSKKKPFGFEDEYFAPCIVNSNGSIYPDIKDIPESILGYIENIAKSTNNLFIKSRYYDFLWYKLRDYTFALIAIDNYFDLGIGLFKECDELAGLPYINRSIDISLMLNKKDIVNKIINKIFELIYEIINLNRTRYVLELSDILIEKFKILNDDERKRLIVLLKLGYLKHSRLEPKNYHIRRHFLFQIEKIFRKFNNKSELKKIHLKIAKSFEKEAYDSEKLGLPSILISKHLDDALNYYRLSGYNVRKTNELLIKLKNINKKVNEEMKAHRISTKISKKEIENFFNNIENINKYELIKLVIGIDLKELGIIDFGSALNITKDSFKDSIFLSLTSWVIYDEYNNITCMPESIDEKLEFFTIHDLLIYQYNMISQIILNRLFNILFHEKNASVDDLIYYILKSDIISENRIIILKVAIEKYLEKDYVSFLHISIIQIEGILRDLLYILGCNPSKRIREMRYVEKNLNDILDDEEIKKNLKKDDFSLIKYVLSDIRGMNLRNKLAHGLLNYEAFNDNLSSLLMLILLRLCRYSFKQ
jgi:uncharacterized protein involved in tolerance to divalent cations